MPPFLLFFILILLAVGVGYWAYYTNPGKTINVKLHYHSMWVTSPLEVVTWYLGPLKLRVAEATHIDDGSDTVTLTMLWDSTRRDCKGMAAAHKRLVSRLGSEVKIPRWYPSWLRSKLLHNECLVKMDKPTYDSLIEQLSPQRRR